MKDPPKQGLLTLGEMLPRRFSDQLAVVAGGFRVVDHFRGT